MIDELQIMLHQEQEEFGLDIQQSIDINIFMSEDLRLKICEWAFGVADHFGYDREIAVNSLYLLQQVVQKQNKKNNQRDFQFIALTCLYISIRLYENINDSSSSQNDDNLRKIQLIFVKSSQRNLSVESLEVKKEEVLQILECNGINNIISPIIPLHIVEISLRLFLSSMERIAGDREKNIYHYIKIIDILYETARYFSELAVCISSTFNFKSSEVAYACILCAFDVLLQQNQQQTVMAKALNNNRIITSCRAEFIKDFSIRTYNSENNLTPKNIAPIQQLLREQYSAGMFLATKR